MTGVNYFSDHFNLGEDNYAFFIYFPTISVIDVAGVFITSVLIGAFAASGGLAAVGIGLGASIFIEGAKWAATEILKD